MFISVAVFFFVFALSCWLTKSSMADHERTNQSARICLRLALPYNNQWYFISWGKYHWHFLKARRKLSDNSLQWAIYSRRTIFIHIWIITERLSETNFVPGMFCCMFKRVTKQAIVDLFPNQNCVHFTKKCVYLFICRFSLHKNIQLWKVEQG